MTRRLAPVFAVAAGLLVAWAVGRFFVTSVGGGGREEAAGVVLAPPADAVVEAAGELDAAEAAKALARHAVRHATSPRVALTTTRAGSQVILVLDRETGTVEELRAAASGTRVAKIWKGSLEVRLAAARDRGTFDAPGLALPQEKNLYH